MDVFDAITTQRAVRRFADRLVEPEKLELILDAGHRAPSSKNEQRWAFVVCTERERLRQLSRIGDYAEHLAGAAAAVAFVTPESEAGWERESIAFDLGQCVQNMMLAAWGLRIGSCHVAVYDEAMTRDLLGYPKGWRCDYLISLGYPARTPKRPGERESVDRLVHRECW